MLGMISAALFYGDAMITPALSVLSAVEGLEVIAPASGAYVVPLSVVILFALFMVQSHGTARVASFLGHHARLVYRARPPPASIMWPSIRPCSRVQSALRRQIPVQPRLLSAATLGAVFLVVTGAEALYADLGHFGRGPIHTAWLPCVCPR